MLPDRVPFSLPDIVRNMPGVRCIPRLAPDERRRDDIRGQRKDNGCSAVLVLKVVAEASQGDCLA